MHLKEKSMALRPTAERDNARKQQNRRIQDAATTSNKHVLMNLQAALCGLDEETVLHNRNQYGSNKVTHEKKKSLAKRLAKEKETAPSPPADYVDYAAEAQKELSSQLGRGVRIVKGRKKGRIELEYYGMDDLNDLLEALAAIRVHKHTD